MTYEVTPPLIEVKNLSAYYSVNKFMIFDTKIAALENINFAIGSGQTLAVSGDAGSGKSTLLKILNGDGISYEGEIYFYGKKLTDYERQDRVSFLRMMYPDPDTALNPHVRINKILELPLVMNTNLTEQERQTRIVKTLEYVGLRPEHGEYYLAMLNGIQKLRVSLARALIMQPKILLVDSSIEKLDAILRMQFYNIFMKLQHEYGMSLIIVINDLGIIKHMADKILVLDHGKQADMGSVAKVLTQPESDLTRRILQSYNHEYRSIHK